MRSAKAVSVRDRNERRGMADMIVNGVDELIFACRRAERVNGD
jgi:hypothetical protein